MTDFVGGANDNGDIVGNGVDVAIFGVDGM